VSSHRPCVFLSTPRPVIRFGSTPPRFTFTVHGVRLEIVAFPLASLPQQTWRARTFFFRPNPSLSSDLTLVCPFQQTVRLKRKQQLANGNPAVFAALDKQRGLEAALGFSILLLFFTHRLALHHDHHHFYTLSPNFQDVLLGVPSTHIQRTSCQRQYRTSPASGTLPVSPTLAENRRASPPVLAVKKTSELPDSPTSPSDLPSLHRPSHDIISISATSLLKLSAFFPTRKPPLHLQVFFAKTLTRCR